MFLKMLLCNKRKKNISRCISVFFFQLKKNPFWGLRIKYVCHPPLVLSKIGIEQLWEKELYCYYSGSNSSVFSPFKSQICIALIRPQTDRRPRSLSRLGGWCLMPTINNSPRSPPFLHYYPMQCPHPLRRRRAPVLNARAARHPTRLLRQPLNSKECI